MKLYDFGVEVRGRKPEALKAIAWPINAWTCYVPENVNPQLNILEKLILSLIKKEVVKNRKDIIEILVKQIGLNGDLVENVIDECSLKYFNQNYKELKLNAKAEDLMSAIDDDISPEMKMSETTKKIYLFQDAVTNTVIPCFNIESLPAVNDADYIDEKDCVVLNSVCKSQPKTAAINNSLRQWGRIYSANNSGETEAKNQIDMQSEPVDINDEENFLIDESPVITLAEKESQPKKIEAITVFDDEPRCFAAKGYLAFNPSNPTEIEIISPFGKVFDNWFMKLVNKLRVINDQFAEELQLFLMERTELLKDTVAFGNDLDIQLFDDYPVICNDSKYADLKKTIKDLSKDVERIKNGEDESTNFAKNLRTAIEVVFRTAIKANPEISRIKYDYCAEDGFFRYKREITQLVDVYRLNDELKQRFTQKSIYKNMVASQSNPKDNAALILLYANRHPNSHVIEFVKSYREIFLDLFTLTSLGTDAGHAGDNFTTMYFSPNEVEQYYSQYENMVRALFSCMIEGVSNG